MPQPKYKWSRKYRWRTPLEWLLEEIKKSGCEDLEDIARSLAVSLTDDEIQDLFQERMTEYDYFVHVDEYRDTPFEQLCKLLRDLTQEELKDIARATPGRLTAREIWSLLQTWAKVAKDG